MSSTAPHYLLLSDTQSDRSSNVGSWSFVLERIDGSARIEAADQEPNVQGERLQLLAVVRGLEALEQPSKVTLITPSRFISRGFRNGISVWRENNWQWERFGIMTEVKNSDLWQRIERANTFHQIDCRVWNFARYLSDSSDVVTTPNICGYDNDVNRPFALPSWTEIASVVANRITAAPPRQAYGCA